MTETELKAAAWDRMYKEAKKADREYGRPLKIEVGGRSLKIETGIRVKTAMDRFMKIVKESA